ncbi:hypothetical protein ACSBR1_027360 [Camellia fascicularis]
MMVLILLKLESLTTSIFQTFLIDPNSKSSTIWLHPNQQITTRPLFYSFKLTFFHATELSLL